MTNIIIPASAAPGGEVAAVAADGPVLAPVERAQFSDEPSPLDFGVLVDSSLNCLASAPSLDLGERPEEASAFLASADYGWLQNAKRIGEPAAMSKSRPPTRVGHPPSENLHSDSTPRGELRDVGVQPIFTHMDRIRLADGTEIPLLVAAAVVDWLGEPRPVKLCSKSISPGAKSGSLAADPPGCGVSGSCRR